MQNPATENNSNANSAPAQADASQTTPGERRFQINMLPFGIMKKFLVITPQGITYGDKTIETDAVNSITTQIVRSSTNGIRTSTSYTLTLGSETGFTAHSINFSDIFYGSAKGKMFGEIMELIMQHAGMSLLTRLVARIQSENTVTIGPATFRRDGVMLTPTKMLVFKGDPILVPYERLEMELSDGNIELSDRENKKAQVEFSMGGTSNGYMVDVLFDYLVAKEGWRDLSS